MHRAVVADECGVLRRGIRAVLLESGVDHVTVTGTATEAVTEAESVAADIVVFGVTPDMHAAEAIAQARAHVPNAHVIVLDESPDRTSLVDLLERGADALLTRTPDDDELRDAIARVQKGERFVSPGLLAMLFGDDPGAAAGAGDVDDLLTERQQYVLRLAAEGRSNKQIAGQLFIGEATVKTHLRKIYDKLGVRNRMQAVGRAMELRALH